MKKKMTFLALTLLIVFLTPTSALAAEFSAYSEGTRYNRIFTLEIYLQDETASFCGALLEVSFDPDILEFRGADPAVSGAELDTYVTDGNINIVFMSTKPINCTEDTQIFGLDFISKSGGSGNFDIQITEAVDDNAQLMETNAKFICPYTVTEKGNGEFYVSSTKSSNFKIKTSSSGKDADTVENTSDETDSYKPNPTPINLIERNNYPYILALIIFIIASLTVIITRIIRFKIIEKKKEAMKKKNKSEE